MKILVLSGQNDAANARHARTLGAAEFVAKPCDPENLKKILLHALQFRAAEISGEGIADQRSPGRQKSRPSEIEESDQPIRRFSLPGAHRGRIRKPARKSWRTCCTVFRGGA